MKNKNNNNKKIVFVGVSGGVDSSVSVALLKEQNFNVVGVFIHTWTPDFIKCTWRDERRDAMRVCASLEVPFLECEAESIYKKEVVDYMISEYKKGNTPNPDVMCNRAIKFGIFWDFAKKYGADFIATGHYARLEKNNMERGVDLSKDQSYFLWTLKQEDLSHIIFPIGDFKKTKVRELAKKYDIPVADKKDSQGVCFLGLINMKDFLKHYIQTKKGNVLNEKGEIIGYHSGAVFFTLGERHGFTITKNKNNNEAFYIINKDISQNTITVSLKSNLNKIKSNKVILCNNSNWINKIPIKNKKYTAQIRYHGELKNCRIEVLENDKFKVTFGKNLLVDKGQSIVVYDKEICFGGGIVE